MVRMNHLMPALQNTGYVHYNFDLCTICVFHIWSSQKNCNRIVPYFGGRYLDTDPNLSQYWDFWGTIIDVHIDEKPNKMGTMKNPRKGYCA